MKIKELFETSSIYKPNLKPWMYKSKEEILKWCKLMNFDRAQVSKELEVHLADDFYIHSFGDLTNDGLVLYNGKYRLPVRLGVCTTIKINHWDIQDLEGMPNVVLKGMNLNGVNLTSLKGLPSFVGNPDTWDSNYQIKITNRGTLKNFEGMSSQITGFYYSGKFKSYVGLSPEMQFLYLENVFDLPSLVQQCSNLKTFCCFEYNPSKNRTLSLFKCKQLNSVLLSSSSQYQGIPDEDHLASKIINKHLKTRDVLSCQEELMDNGLIDYAK